jgi:hypothetical protein
MLFSRRFSIASHRRRRALSAPEPDRAVSSLVNCGKAAAAPEQCADLMPGCGGFAERKDPLSRSEFPYAPTLAFRIPDGGLYPSALSRS